MHEPKGDEPKGDLTLRTLAMPADANAAGDIFGGWVMAQMDLACGIRAAERAGGRVVTAAVHEMSFARPMKVGDTLCIYTAIEKIGRTSMTLQVEAWAQRYLTRHREMVTHARFIMVALDDNGKPTPIPGKERNG
jgi:acyl-CoA thioesterase YciA